MLAVAGGNKKCEEPVWALQSGAETSDEALECSRLRLYNYDWPGSFWARPPSLLRLPPLLQSGTSDAGPTEGERVGYDLEGTREMATGASRGRRWPWTVFLGRDEVYRCLAFSEKEAIDDLAGTLGDVSLEEFCAEQGMTVDDLRAEEE